MENEKDEAAGKKKSDEIYRDHSFRVNVKGITRKFGLGRRSNNVGEPGI